MEKFPMKTLQLIDRIVSDEKKSFIGIKPEWFDSARLLSETNQRFVNFLVQSSLRKWRKGQFWKYDEVENVLNLSNLKFGASF